MRLRLGEMAAQEFFDVGGPPLHAAEHAPNLPHHGGPEGGGAALYLADDPGIADRACPSAGAEGASAIAVLADQSRLTNLTVPAGKRMCATTEDPTMRVAWHARTGDAPVRSMDVALLSR